MTRWMTLVEAWLVAGSMAERLCLTLAHSLWQFGLLALAVWLVETIGRQLSFAARYNLCLAMLLVGIAALPLTWNVLPAIEPASQQTAAREMLPSGATEASQTAVADRAWASSESDLSGAAPGALPTAVLPIAAVAASPQSQLALATRWIAAAYGLGVCLMLGRLAGGVWRGQRTMRVAQPIVNEPLLLSLRQLASRYKLRVQPHLAAASELAMPCVMGLVRPTILFPLAALNSLSPVELEMILAHELAHVRRRDLWAHLVQRLTEAVLFFNPGMWYVSRRISVLREYCCDELACQRLAADEVSPRLRYAQALVHLAELQIARSNRRGVEQLTSLAAASGSPSQLRRRIAVLLGEPVREPLRLTRSGVMMLVLLAVALFLAPAVVVSNDQPSDAQPSANETTHAAAESLLHDDERFVKKLPSGVEVKLLAIGTRGEPVQRWWLPEGTLLDGEPYHVKDFERIEFPGPLTREAVFSMENVPEDARWQFIVRRSNGVNSQGGVADAKGNRLRHHHANVSSLPADSQTFQLEVGVGGGEWKTVAACQNRNLRGLAAIADRGVIFSGPFTMGGSGGWLYVSHSLSEQTRLITIGKDGNRHIALSGGSTNADGLVVDQFSFKMDVDSLAWFEFQSRPYEWAVFDDLPVQPVQVTWNANYKLAVNVLAIGYGDAVDKPGPRWWNADGTPREAPATTFSGRRNPRLMPSPRARQVVFELPDYHAGSAVRFEIKSKSGWSRGELSVSELDAPEGQPKILHEVHAIAPDDDEIMTLRVGRADGDWKTVYSGDAGAVAQGNNEQKGVVFSGAFVQNGLTAVAVSHNWHGQNTRLIAIDKKRQRHTGNFSAHLAAAETVNQTIFEFPGLKPDEIAEFNFQVQDFTWTTIDNLPANPKPPADAKATVSGRIRLEDGSAPTQKGWLYTLHRKPNGNSSMETKGTFTDQYTFNVPAGKLWLTYFTDDFAPATAGPFEIGPGQKLKDLDLVLRPGVTWHLKFQNEEGEPVVATANAVPFIDDGLTGPVKPFTADANGVLSLEHMTQSVAYQLSVSAAGYQPTSLNLPTNTVPPNTADAPVVITMRRALPATGVVRLLNGEPARGAQLHIRAEVTPASGIAFTKKAVPVDDEGRFSIDELADDKFYLVMAEGPDGARVMLPPVVAGQTGIDVSISPRRDLKVHLIGDLDKLEQRKNAPTIRVGQQYLMKTPSGPSYGDYLGETVDVSATDDGGTAVYKGLIDAPILVTVGKREYEFDSTESEVTINLDADLDQPPRKLPYQNRY